MGCIPPKEYKTLKRRKAHPAKPGRENFQPETKAIQWGQAWESRKTKSFLIQQGQPEEEPQRERGGNCCTRIL